MMKYKYYTRAGMEFLDHEQFEENMNSLGVAGWKLTAMVPAAGVRYSRWIFMREIAEVEPHPRSESSVDRIVQSATKEPQMTKLGFCMRPWLHHAGLHEQTNQCSNWREPNRHWETGNATNHRISECGPACGKTIRCHDDVVDRVEGGSL